MTKSEKIYFEKYKMVREVALEECYMGSKNCGTCAHCREYDSNFWSFKNSYCTCAKKAPD